MMPDFKKERPFYAQTVCKAQDPSAVKPMRSARWRPGGRSAVSASGRLDGCGHTGGGGGLCFCLSMAALYAASAIYTTIRHCRQRRSEAGCCGKWPAV